MGGDTIKFLKFSAAFAVTSVLLLVIVGCYFLPSEVSRSQNEEVTSYGAGIKEQDGKDTAKILAVYDGGETVLACIITVNGGVSSAVCGENGVLDERLVSVYRNDGIFALADRFGGPMYIKFTPETFEKTADIFHGMVYNDNGTKRFMTGGQAAKNIDGALLSDFCAETVKRFYPNRAEEFSKLVSGLCENSLSYPLLYGAFFRED